MAPAFRSLTLAIVTVMLLTGCAARRQLVAPLPGDVSVLPQSAEAGHGGEAPERVKNAIKSLGQEFRRRIVKSPRALARLEPIPLIGASSPARAVATSGVWSVVETTHATQPKEEPISQTQTRSAESRPVDRKSSTPWVLVGIGTAVLVGAIAARRLFTAAGIEHS
jgi:hypothetical protein